jgi:Secretion system C-terminal sorting domain
MQRTFLALLLALFAYASCIGQATKHALFLGNSYTYYNDLPALTANVALSAGDTLIVFSSTPGGYTLANHLNNATSMSYITAGQWDFVVLQEQSQMPAFPIEQVEAETFPFATQLNDSILAHSPCAETVFYMTWGRQDGDQQNCANWPPVCTYEGMDDLLRERYMMMAEMNQGIVSPVGAVRRFLHENYPDINLYAADGSHPSPEGSYAAALCFYTSFFRKSPLNATFDYTIDNAQEAIIRQVVHDLVFLQQSQWHIGSWDPIAAATMNTANIFLNESAFADEVYYAIDNAAIQPWIQDSLMVDQLDPGSHTLAIIAGKCGVWDTTSIYFDILSDVPLLQTKSDLWVYPNPAFDVLQIHMPATIQYAQLSLIDSKGVTIDFPATRSAETMTINCGNLPRGFYLLRISEGKTHHYHRVILQ